MNFKQYETEVKLVVASDVQDEFNKNSLKMGIKVSAEFATASLNFILNKQFQNLISIKKISNTKFSVVTKEYRSFEEGSHYILATQTFDIEQALRDAQTAVSACMMESKCTDQLNSTVAVHEKIENVAKNK